MGFGPAAEVLFFREKDPKPLTPRLASLKRRAANFLKSGPTRRAHTRSAKCEERPSRGPAGRRRDYGPSGNFGVSLVGRPAGGGEDVSVDGWMKEDRVAQDDKESPDYKGVQETEG